MSLKQLKKVKMELGIIKQIAQNIILECLMFQKQQSLFIQDLKICLKQILKKRFYSNHLSNISRQYQEKIQQLNIQLRKYKYKSQQILQLKEEIQKQLRHKKIQTADMNYNNNLLKKQIQEKNIEINKLNFQLKKIKTNYFHLEKKVDYIIAQQQKKFSLTARYNQTKKQSLDTIVQKQQQNIISNRQSRNDDMNLKQQTMISISQNVNKIKNNKNSNLFKQQQTIQPTFSYFSFQKQFLQNQQQSGKLISKFSQSFRQSLQPCERKSYESLKSYNKAYPLEILNYIVNRKQNNYIQTPSHNNRKLIQNILYKSKQKKLYMKHKQNQSFSHGHSSNQNFFIDKNIRKHKQQQNFRLNLSTSTAKIKQANDKSMRKKKIQQKGNFQLSTQRLFLQKQLFDFDQQQQEYEGHRKNYLKHGKGILKYKNGYIYDGQFVKNKRQGIGQFQIIRYLFFKQNIIYQGSWLNNRFHGHGKLINPFSTQMSWYSYIGQFINGQFHGAGTLTFTNKDKLTGIFKNGMPNKEASLKKANGIELKIH